MVGRDRFRERRMRIVYKAAIVAVLGAVIQTISAVAQDQPKFASDEYLLIGDKRHLP